jgi:nitric oxide reductase large subunit
LGAGAYGVVYKVIKVNVKLLSRKQTPIHAHVALFRKL